LLVLLSRHALDLIRSTRRLRNVAPDHARNAPILTLSLPLNKRTQRRRQRNAYLLTLHLL
jgi:hypothetical protein